MNFQICRLLLFIWAISSFSFLFAAEEIQKKITLPRKEMTVLDSFLEVLFKKSEGGYVFFDKKPVCINHFQAASEFYGKHEKHFQTTLLHEAKAVWEKLPTNESSNFIIHIAENQSPQENSYVLVINKKMFLDVVKENLSLFQYALGPNVSPQSLLDKILEKKSSFFEVLKNDRVLIGIVLGFGVQNALHVSRIEDLQTQLFNSAEEFPIKNRAQLYLGGYQEILLLSESNEQSAANLNPSFSFTSLEQEIRDTLSKITCSSDKLSTEEPYFIFGRLRDEENDRFVKQLEETQKNIVDLLKNAAATKIIFEKLFPKYDFQTDSNDQLDSLDNKNGELESIISKQMWRVISNRPKVYQEGFFKGLYEADKNMKNSISLPPDYFLLKAIDTAKKNVDEADLFFKKLDNDPSTVKIRKGELYYKILISGSGSIIRAFSLKTIDSICGKMRAYILNKWR